MTHIYYTILFLPEFITKTPWLSDHGCSIPLLRSHLFLLPWSNLVMLLLLPRAVFSHIDLSPSIASWLPVYYQAIPPSLPQRQAKMTSSLRHIPS